METVVADHRPTPQRFVGVVLYVAAKLIGFTAIHLVLAMGTVADTITFELHGHTLVTSVREIATKVTPITVTCKAKGSK